MALFISREERHGKIAQKLFDFDAASFDDRASKKILPAAFGKGEARSSPCAVEAEDEARHDRDDGITAHAGYEVFGLRSFSDYRPDNVGPYGVVATSLEIR